MRLQTAVAVGAWLLSIASLSKATPVGDSSKRLPNFDPSPTTYDSPPHRASLLLERDEWLTNLGNGWAAYYQTWESYIPVQFAATTLSHFYSLVIDEVQGGTSSLGNPETFRAFEWDNLRLEFSSDSATIPWGFIARFAARMAAMTQRGFTAQFNAVYVHMATEQSIRISLMVLRDVARSGVTGQNY